MDLKNLDTDNMLQILKNLGIDLEELDEKKRNKIMNISEKIKDPSKVSQNTYNDIIKTLGISKKKLNKVKNGNINSKKPIINDNKIGRNDLCNCNSGKKYKKCCLKI